MIIESVSSNQAPCVSDLEDFFENAAIALHIVAADGTILRVNQAELDMLGYQREEYVGRHIAQFHADQDNIETILHALGRGEKLYRHPARLRARDGSIRHVLITSNALFRDGQFVHTRCFTVDVTETKHAEERSREWYRQLLEALPAAVYTTDAEGRITYYNQAAVDLAGRRPQLGSDEWCVTWRLYNSDGTPLPHDECPMAVALKEKRPIRGAEAIFERPDGTRAPFQPYPTPLWDDQTGEMIGAVNMLVDLSERKQAEETQQLLVSELSHRVKNTLATVQAIAQQTLRLTRTPADFVASFSARMQGLSRVHNLLSKAAWKGADLKTLIRDQVLLGPIDESRLTAWGPAVMLEPQMALHLAMMLHELGTNSCKYGALSGPVGWVTVSWSVKDRVLQMQWAERGGPVVTASGARGFGTMLIEQSTRAHGGNAQMSCQAQGIVWDITLPLPRAPEIASSLLSAAAIVDVAAEQKADGAGNDSVIPLAGKRVLVVEDEALVGLDLVASLAEAGMEPLGPAATLAEALRMIGSVFVDCALVDANLHGQSTDEIAAALTRRKVPFAFVSGYGRENLPQAFRGAVLIAKPFTRDEVLKTVSQLLSPATGAAIPMRGRPGQSTGLSFTS